MSAVGSISEDVFGINVITPHSCGRSIAEQNRAGHFCLLGLIMSPARFLHFYSSGSSNRKGSK